EMRRRVGREIKRPYSRTDIPVCHGRRYASVRRSEMRTSRRVCHLVAGKNACPSGKARGAAMDYVRLGKSGLKVSRICLGCMSYGVPERGGHPWSLTEEKSRPFIKRALEVGINFFDTANVYSDGTSEEIVGRALKDFAKREEIVLATKVRGRVRPGPNGEGLSRKAILMEMDASLKR